MSVGCTDEVSVCSVKDGEQKDGVTKWAGLSVQGEWSGLGHQGRFQVFCEKSFRRH